MDCHRVRPQRGGGQGSEVTQRQPVERVDKVPTKEVVCVLTDDWQLAADTAGHWGSEHKQQKGREKGPARDPGVGPQGS